MCQALEIEQQTSRCGPALINIALEQERHRIKLVDKSTHRITYDVGKGHEEKAGS